MVLILFEPKCYEGGIFVPSVSIDAKMKGEDQLYCFLSKVPPFGNKHSTGNLCKVYYYGFYRTSVLI